MSFILKALQKSDREKNPKTFIDPPAGLYPDREAVGPPTWIWLLVGGLGAMLLVAVALVVGMFLFMRPKVTSTPVETPVNAVVVQPPQPAPTAEPRVIVLVATPPPIPTAVVKVEENTFSGNEIRELIKLITNIKDDGTQAEPAAEKPLEVSITGIIYNKESPMAFINEKMVEEGEIVDGLTVEKIHPDGVKFKGHQNIYQVMGK